MVIVFLIFVGLYIVFSTAVHHFTFPTKVQKGSNVSTPSATFAIICCFEGSHPSGCEVKEVTSEQRIAEGEVVTGRGT